MSSFPRVLFKAGVAGLLMLAGSVFAQDSFDFPPREPSPLAVRQIHSGHSLSDVYLAWPWPGRLTLATSLRSSADAYETVAKSTIPGSSLAWRWDTPAGYGQPDARLNISDYELLVTTESVPLHPTFFEEQSLGSMRDWVRHSWNEGNGGKGAELLLYSTWVWWQNPEDTQPGGEAHIPFRERLEIEGARWEQLQDHANASRPEGMPPVYMIPGHRLMMRLYDDIEAGKAPGLTSIGDVFTDDIHPNDIGNYAITCLVYAVIYQRHPKELPNKLAKPEDTLSRDQALYLKRLAWDVATAYPRAGIPDQG